MHPATESYNVPTIDVAASSSAGGTSSATRFTLPAITRHTSIALCPSVQPMRESWATPLLAVVRTPLHSLPWNPCLMMVHTPQSGIELHKLDDPRAPRAHVRLVQWNRSNSFPSAAHLGFFLVLFNARVLTTSLQSSNRWIVR